MATLSEIRSACESINDVLCMRFNDKSKLKKMSNEELTKLRQAMLDDMKKMQSMDVAEQGKVVASDMVKETDPVKLEAMRKKAEAIEKLVQVMKQ